MTGKCVICGRDFKIDRRGTRRKTCSAACHAENRRRLQNEVYARHAEERAAQKIRGETAAKTLARVNAEARAAHVSYGHYVAIRKDAEARKLRPEEVKARLEAASTW